MQGRPVRPFSTKANDVFDTLCFAASAGAAVGAVTGAVLGAIAGFAFALWATSHSGYTNGVFPMSMVAGAVIGAAAGAIGGGVVGTALAGVTVAPYSYFRGRPSWITPRSRNSICSSLFGFFGRVSAMVPAPQPSLIDDVIVPLAFSRV